MDVLSLPPHLIFLCNISGSFCPDLRIMLLLRWFILGPKFKSSFLYTTSILDSDSLNMLVFTIKCSIKLQSLNLHLCNIKKLLVLLKSFTLSYDYTEILLYLYKYMICSSKSLMFVALNFSVYLSYWKLNLVKNGSMLLLNTSFWLDSAIITFYLRNCYQNQF